MKILFLIAGICFSIVANAQKDFEIYALKYAVLKEPTPISNWVQGGPEKDSVPISFHFWLIKTPENRNILVDAGCRMDLSNAIDFGLTNYERPDSVLLRLGVAAGDITDIIISHPHWDHIDGLPLFANATVWMQQTEYSYYTGEVWQKGNKPGGIAKRNIEHLLQLNMAGKLKLVAGDNHEIIKGITVFTGSRHTYNSQYVLVSSGRNKVVIASDNIWVYFNLHKMLPPPSYGTMSAAGYIKNMERMKLQASKPAYILPGHDETMFTQFPTVDQDGRIIRIL